MKNKYDDAYYNDPYANGFTNELKEMARDRANRRCERCNKKESECRRKLDVHHKDLNKRNNNIDNLEALCQSCHMKFGPCYMR